MPNQSTSAILTEIIRNRRSVFPPAFSDKRISDTLIEEILENANWAPTHKMTEPWRFHVITDQGRTRLSELAGAWYKDHMLGEAFKVKKLEKIMRNPLLSSHIIAICVQRDSEERIPQWEEEAAVACAVQNLWLSVTASGLGGYWSTPKYVEALKPLLDLNEGEYCIGLFYLGIPQDGYVARSTRTSISKKVKWYR